MIYVNVKKSLKRNRMLKLSHKKDKNENHFIKTGQNKLNPMSIIYIGAMLYIKLQSFITKRNEMTVI